MHPQQARKTHTTAVVLIPPTEVWEPMQAIRQRHDRHFKRWMPHVTLLYPFLPHQQFEPLKERFATVCRTIQPFYVAFREVRFFRHRRENFTLWLAPEPKASLVGLQAALGRLVPECNDVTQHHGGFTPHLSLGQVRGEGDMQQLQQALQAAWQPCSFLTSEVCMIWRGAPPDDVFRVAYTIQLGT